MTNWKPSLTTEDFGSWVVYEAIGKNHNLISEMKRNADGSYPIFFSVGGVELNFDNVVKRIEECFSDAVANKAQELLDDKYSHLINEIDDIQKRINEQKELFKYDWE